MPRKTQRPLSENEKIAGNHSGPGGSALNDEPRPTEGSTTNATQIQSHVCLTFLCVCVCGARTRARVQGLCAGAPRELFQEHISRVASGINRRCRGVARFFLLHTFRALSSFFSFRFVPPSFFSLPSSSLSRPLCLVVE